MCVLSLMFLSALERSLKQSNVRVLFAKFLLDRFCVFVPEDCSTSQVIFSGYSSSFLSDLNCSHCLMKFVAYVKAIVA